MGAHELITPTTTIEWASFHTIRREVLFEARGQFGTYDANHPQDRAPHNHPKLLLYNGDPVGVVRIDVDGSVAALRRVAIRADVQRRGHGRIMLMLAQRFAEEARCTRLVSSVDADAVPFYQRCGFVIAEERAVARSADAPVFMTKELAAMS
jgi:GNAT superfamily N-acetyltransferase